MAATQASLHYFLFFWGLMVYDQNSTSLVSRNLIEPPFFG